MIPINELVILPGTDGATLCRITKHDIEILHDLDFNFSDRHVIGEEGWVIALCNTNIGQAEHSLRSVEKNFLYRALILEDGRLERLPDIALPRLSLNQTLAIKGNVVFMGGHQLKNSDTTNDLSIGELAGSIHLLEDQPEWQPLPIPVELKSGKSIDDVLIYNNKLVLVDNIIFPKYLFEYDISNPLLPVHTQTVDLPNNGTYEHIYRGAINENWLALFSSGVGRGGTSNYISVLRLPEYQNVFSLSLHFQEGKGLLVETTMKPFNLKEEIEKAQNQIKIHDFTLTNDRLLVACGHHGIINFQLDKWWDKICEPETQSEIINYEAVYQNSRRARVKSGGYRSLNEVGKDKEEWFMPEGFDTVDKLVQLSDNRVIAVSTGETGRSLAYQVLFY